MDRPRVQLTVGKTKINALLDTGSCVTVIPYHIWKGLGLAMVTDGEESPTVFSATGHQITIVGRTILPINQGRFHITAHIIDKAQFSAPLLIGVDSLIPGKAQFNFANKSLTWFNTHFTLRLGQDKGTDSQIDSIGSRETVEIPVASSPCLQAVLQHYRKVFDGIGPSPNPDVVPECCIETTGTPIKQRAYRAELAKRQEIEAQIEDMLSKGIIRPSCSPWASPVTLVPKKDGSTRFCVDYRKLNDVTIKDAHPLPAIQDIFDNLGGSTIFSTLDLKSGYWQIPISEKDKEKTAFCSHTGLFQFERMPFGLCNTPSIFQRTMNTVLQGLIGRICFVYVDDIIIYSPSQEKHVDHLQQVLQRMEDAGLKLKANKCNIGHPKVDLLGYVVSKDGISPSTEKVAAMRNMNPPRSKKELQSFLGTVNYYRQCVPNFASIAEPLYRLTHDNVPFEWKEEHQEVFEQLKGSLTADTTMAFPDNTRPFKLYTDASDYAIGAILTQDDDDGVDRPIHYVSKSLTAQQRRWSTIEKEAWAVIYALNKLRPYLWGSTFTIFTDHKPLIGLFKQPIRNPKVQRWAVQWAQSGAPIQHIKGKRNLRADLLS